MNKTEFEKFLFWKLKEHVKEENKNTAECSLKLYALRFRRVVELVQGKEANFLPFRFPEHFSDYARVVQIVEGSYNILGAQVSALFVIWYLADVLKNNQLVWEQEKYKITKEVYSVLPLEKRTELREIFFQCWRQKKNALEKQQKLWYSHQETISKLDSIQGTGRLYFSRVYKVETKNEI